MRIVSIKYVFCLTEAQVSEKSSTEKSSRTFKGPHTSTQTFTQYTCQYLLRGLLERRSRGGLQNDKVTNIHMLNNENLEYKSRKP